MPAPMAVDPQRRYVFRRPQATGRLRPHQLRHQTTTPDVWPKSAASPLDGDPVHISVDRTGRYLLSAPLLTRPASACTASARTARWTPLPSNGGRPASAPTTCRPTRPTATPTCPTSPRAPHTGVNAHLPVPLRPADWAACRLRPRPRRPNLGGGASSRLLQSKP